MLFFVCVFVFISQFSFFFFGSVAHFSLWNPIKQRTKPHPNNKLLQPCRNSMQYSTQTHKNTSYNPHWTICCNKLNLRGNVLLEVHRKCYYLTSCSAPPPRPLLWVLPVKQLVTTSLCNVSYALSVLIKNLVLLHLFMSEQLNRPVSFKTRC